jgi:hypothetical protein
MEQPLLGVGSLEVTISPSPAVTAGAQWQVDGGTWQSSTTTVTNLSAGAHTIWFAPVSGWNAPAPQTVAITNGAATTATGVYMVPVQFGTVTALSNGLVQVSMTGQIGQTYVVEVSTNSLNWIELTEITLTNGVGQFVTSTNSFYQAVVLSQAEPQLGAQFVNGMAEISVTGLSGQTYIIEASTDLVNWVPVYTNSSSFTFSDTANWPYRFYRAVIP